MRYFFDPAWGLGQAAVSQEKLGKTETIKMVEAWRTIQHHPGRMKLTCIGLAVKRG